jgi:hypothetical protein
VDASRWDLRGVDRCGPRRVEVAPGDWHALGPHVAPLHLLDKDGAAGHVGAQHGHREQEVLTLQAPLRPRPAAVTDPDTFRVRRHDRVGGVIHEYTLAA